MQPDRIELGLERIKKVAKACGLDKPDFRIVTVAGTNGKGSTVAYINSMLRHNGYSIGVYTSPHFIDFSERIVIDSVPATSQQLCAAFDFIENARDDTALTYFEFTTLAAIYCFVQQGVDIAVLEVGLGGRLDAVNAWDSEVACITSIGLDHTDWLGDDLESIGREKAGVARAGCALVCGAKNPPQSVIDKAAETGAELLLSGRHFGATTQESGSWGYYGPHGEMQLQQPAMAGSWARENASVAICACGCFLSRQVDKDTVQKALDEVVILGRMQQLLFRGVNVLLDVAHNHDAAARLGDYLESGSGKTRAVFGCMQDKDADAVVQQLARSIDHWFIAEIDYPRAMPAIDLAGISGPRISSVFTSVILAFEEAVAQSDPGDRVVVFGSFHVVGPVLAYLDESRPV
ncbi:hypothetical protein AB833_06905 [Chromatiales bacterium (ex Bugula neritina AB1)]|nr:hypothetical protein AB833_06905 [Chromatiales bacterium (ex Bugula neritina AB1)]